MIVKELRKQRGITQEELCNMLQVSQSTLSGWENEKHEPTISQLIALGNFFECSIDYLVGRSDERK